MMRLKTMTLADMHEFQREAVRIETEITIARSPEDVFDYVTTPALWHNGTRPRWACMTSSRGR